MNEIKSKEYYESLDKRSKEYKEWKKSQTIESSKGLGDVIESALESVGINKTDDCGCNERKNFLNKVMRFSSKRVVVNCFTDDQLKQWEGFLKKYDKLIQKEKYITNVTDEERKILIEIGKTIFAVDYTHKLKGCSNCVKYLIVDINRVYEKTKEK